MLAWLPLALLAAGFAPRMLLAQSACRAADTTSAALRLDIGRISSATSGGDRVVRDSLKLPLVPTNQIAVVTSGTVCTKALRAYQSYWSGRGGTAFSSQMYVLQIGGVYAAYDPVYRYRAGGDYPIVLFLDSHFRPLSVY